ncbi:DUF4865 family protein [Paraburkholderia sp. JPY465]|uniref:DUF4865 family protein n=1 Tax=Paraburkholderia sp. JPY465 TaxID=3042285 RepID=UPI003D1F9B2D
MDVTAIFRTKVRLPGLRHGPDSQRGRTRGLLWNDADELAFKAFALRERGKHGAHHNTYTSIYLWLREGAATKFLTGPRFESVLQTFGRPPIQTWLPVDVRAEHSVEALSIYREDVNVPDGADLGELREARDEAQCTGGRPRGYRSSSGRPGRAELASRALHA